jgi:transcriptional regulator with XRE-family HTH domain
MAGETDPRNRALGEAIMLERRRRKLSQDELATRAGLPAGSVSRFELGSGSLEVGQLRAIAEVLEVDWEAIVRTSDALYENDPRNAPHLRQQEMADLSPELRDALRKHAGDSARLDMDRHRLDHRMLRETLESLLRRRLDPSGDSD